MIQVHQSILRIASLRRVEEPHPFIQLTQVENTRRICGSLLHLIHTLRARNLV